MLYILLQADGSSLLSQMPLFAIMIAIFYFFFIRPTTKKQKEQETFLTTLEKGKEVVTASGIIGKITKLEDKEITIQVSEKTFVRMTKGSVSNELTAAFHKVEVKK
ncbi:MAG: preprotein translocase subunit YajC [Saprospiraceae bacterium]|jgi:preprotein translocase subunit YajC